MNIPTLSRRPGRGWLVLVGGSSGHWATTEPIDSAAIASISRDGPIAFLPSPGAEPSYGTSFLAHYTTRGAPQGYVVPIHDAASANEAANARLLSDASLIYISGGDTAGLLAMMAGSASHDALAKAYDAGAVVVGASAGAIGLCAYGIPLDPAVEAFEGWRWLPDVVVSPHHDAERALRLRAAIERRPGHAGVGLPDDTALALGPRGEAMVIGAAGIDFLPGPQFGQT